MNDLNTLEVPKINNNVNYILDILKKQGLLKFDDTYEELKELTGKIKYGEKVCEKINDLNIKVNDLKKKTEDLCKEIKSLV